MRKVVSHPINLFIFYCCVLFSQFSHATEVYGQEFIAIHWWGEVQKIVHGEDDSTITSTVQTALRDTNSIARSPSGQLITISSSISVAGKDKAGIFEIDEDTGHSELLYVVEFPPYPPAGGFSNAVITSAAFNQNGDLYFAKQIPSIGGDDTPIISDLYKLDMERGDYELVGSTLLGSVHGLDFSRDGVLYGWDLGNSETLIKSGLVTINIETGEATDVNPAVSAGTYHILSIGFDEEGLLWGSSKDTLYRIDASTGEVSSPSLILGDRMSIRGIEFPHVSIVDIDIKPGSQKNRINLQGSGIIPVVIFGSESSNVVNMDDYSITFGPSKAEPFNFHRKHHFDINLDGYDDMFLSFKTADTGLITEDSIACISGETLEGDKFEGCDSVETFIQKTD